MPFVGQFRDFVSDVYGPTDANLYRAQMHKRLQKATLSVSEQSYVIGRRDLDMAIPDLLLAHLSYSGAGFSFFVWHFPLRTENPFASLNNCRKSLILAVGMLNVFVAFGPMFAVSTLYTEMLDSFHTTRMETSLVQTCCLGFTFAPGLLTGTLIRRFGEKTFLVSGTFLSFMGLFTSWFGKSVYRLIVTFGCICGLGNGFTYITTIVLVSAVFEKKRSMVIGLLTFSSGVGQMFFPVIFELMSNEYGWKSSFLIISGFCLNTFVLSLLITSSSWANLKFLQPSKIKTESKSTLTAALDPMFLLHALGSGITTGTSNNVLVLFMDFLRFQNITMDNGIRIFIGYQVTSTVTRVLVGALNQYTRIHSGILFILFSLLAGWVFDSTHSYDLAFSVGGIVVIAVSGLTLLVYIFRRCMQRCRVETVKNKVELHVPECTRI